MVRKRFGQTGLALERRFERTGFGIVDRLDTLHDHWRALHRIDDADPMEIDAGFGVAGLDVIRREQQHRIRFEILAILISALPFDPTKAGIFEAADMIIEGALIAGRGADPGVFVHLFLHSAP
jgi:hypothetical protein